MRHIDDIQNWYMLLPFLAFVINTNSPLNVPANDKQADNAHTMQKETIHQNPETESNCFCNTTQTDQLLL